MTFSTMMPEGLMNSGRHIFIPVIIGLCAFTAACFQQKDDVTDIFLTGTGKCAEINVKYTYNSEYPTGGELFFEKSDNHEQFVVFSTPYGRDRKIAIF